LTFIFKKFVKLGCECFVALAPAEISRFFIRLQNFEDNRTKHFGEIPLSNGQMTK